MPTLGEIKTSLSRYIGSNNDANDRINLVRQRLLPMGNWRGTKVPISLNIYSDIFGNPIITLPRQFNTILGGVVRPNTACSGGRPLGTKNGWWEYQRDGHGLAGGGRNDDLIEQNGRYCVFQDWTSPMLLRFKFETTEAAGVILIKGTYNGDDVYSLYSGSWIKGEKVAFVGTANVTSIKYFDAENLSIVKPITNGRVSMYAVDSSGNQVLVAVYDPTDTVPRWRRYKVPRVIDISPVAAEFVIPSQFYTKSEIDSLFGDEGTITVSAAGTHDLVYAVYFLRTVRVVAQAGVGAYVHNFTLDNSAVKKGGVLRVVLEVAQSANPTLNFYDNTTGGPLLQTVLGDSSNAYFATAVFEYSGTNWNFLGFEQ